MRHGGRAPTIASMRHSVLPFLAVVSVVVVASACAYRGADAGSVLGSTLSTRTQAVHNVCPGGDTTFGIDVSTYQNNIDWNAVAGAGVKFAFIRVSDGLTHYDDQYDANWPGAKAAGVMRGTYQFFRSNLDPIAQADLLIEHMGSLDAGDLPPVADVESTDGVDNATRAQKLQQWLDHVEAATGVTPIIYTGGYFWQDSVGADFSRYPLWHAGYTGGNCPSTIADQWSDWAFWQFTSTGTVAGIGNDVDENNFNGTVDQLASFANVTPVCGDGVCNGGEDHGSCAGDCPVCEALPAAGGEIDESSKCFTGGGPQQFMRHVNDAGEGGSLIWTHATDDAAEANFGEWQVLLSEHGHYSIEAYTDAAYAQSHQAKYVVHHGGSDDAVVVDQAAVDGWSTVVADVELDPADGTTVHLADNTGEPVAGQVQLVFDAIRVTRLDGPVAGEGEGEGAVGGEGEGGDEPDPNGHVKRVAIAPPPQGVGGCASVPASAPWIVCVALVALRRRRMPTSR